MTGPEAASAAGSGKPESRNLWLRVASALVLAPLAIGAAYAGGWFFVAFWTIASVGILWEWMRLVDPDRHLLPFCAGACAIAISAALLGLGHGMAAIATIVVGGLAAAVIAGFRQPAWTAGGVLYAGAALVAPALLRADAQSGLFVIYLLFAVVWATDIFGYFVGRAVGGPKLVPSISPKKTWSGALGGTFAAVVLAVLAARWAGRAPLAVGGVALVLSVVSQAGDLFESRIKRLFNAKDSSGLIPGHGGLMDRLDGFVAAGVAAALIGLLRGGFEAPARGLVGW
jgi:phosphatidate cytidylyltransferase